MFLIEYALIHIVCVALSFVILKRFYSMMHCQWKQDRQALILPVVCLGPFGLIGILMWITFIMSISTLRGCLKSIGNICKGVVTDGKCSKL
jgi:hypothetical protein